MKIFRNLGFLFAAILLSASLATCSSGGDDPVPPTPTPPSNPVKPEQPQEPKMCTVTISMEDLVKVEEMPLGRAETTDLFYIRVQKADNTNYAYGLFDKNNSISLTVEEGKDYKMQAFAVKDGKNKIYKNSNGKFAAPFNTTLTNSFTLLSGSTGFPDSPITHILAGSDGQTATVISPIEQFMCFEKSFTAADNMNVAITFDRFASFGTQFTATDMPDGKLYIRIVAEDGKGNTFTSTEVAVSSANTPVKQIFTVGGALYDLMRTNPVNATLILRWVRNNGNTVNLSPANFSLKLNIQYNISIKVDYSSTPSITIQPLNEVGDFVNSENYNVANGTATKQ